MPKAVRRQVNNSGSANTVPTSQSSRVKPMPRNGVGSPPVSKPMTNTHVPNARQTSNQKRSSASSVPHRQATANTSAANNLHTQTKQYRQVQHSGKKITGSAKNMEVKSHTSSRKASYSVNKNKRKGGLKLFLVRAVIFIILTAVFFALFAVAFMSRLKSTKSSYPGYTISIGEETDDDYYTYVSPGSIVGKYLYVNIDELRTMCQFTVTGDTESLRYIPRESDGQSASFVIGSDLCYVNGTSVHLEAPSFQYNGSLYIPVSFFENYISNLNVALNNEDHTISITRSKATADTDSETASDYEPLTFNLAQSVATPNISEESVDED